MPGIFESIPATPEEVEAFAESLKPSHARCRTWGHDPLPSDWYPIKDVEGHPTATSEATMRCTHRCGVKWKLLLDPDFYVLARALDYSGAEGYLSKDGRINQQGKAIIRKHYFTTSWKGPKTNG